MVLRYIAQCKTAVSIDATAIFIQNIFVSIAYFSWNKQRGTNENQQLIVQRKMEYEIFSRKITYLVFWFIQKSYGIALKGLSKLCSSEAWFCNGGIAASYVTSLYLHHHAVHDLYLTIAWCAGLRGWVRFQNLPCTLVIPMLSTVFLTAFILAYQSVIVMEPNSVHLNSQPSSNVSLSRRRQGWHGVRRDLLTRTMLHKRRNDGNNK